MLGTYLVRVAGTEMEGLALFASGFLDGFFFGEELLESSVQAILN